MPINFTVYIFVPKTKIKDGVHSFIIFTIILMTKSLAISFLSP